MRLPTLEALKRFIASNPGLTTRPPKPFPGRRAPTRIAVHYVFSSLDRHWRSFSYIGKPSRYRTLQGQAFLKACRGMEPVILNEMEFDRGGIIAYHKLEMSHISGSRMYEAYHPHGGQGIVANFTRKTHVKRIGGLTVYSYQRKLSNDQIDKFYSWYNTTFSKKLKRPKTAPLIQEGAPSESRNPEVEV